MNEINLDMLDYGLETAKRFGITTLLNLASVLHSATECLRYGLHTAQ